MEGGVQAGIIACKGGKVEGREAQRTGPPACSPNGLSDVGAGPGGA